MKNYLKENFIARRSSISVIKDGITRELKIWLLSIGAGLVFAMIISGIIGIVSFTKTYAINVQNEIADNVIRFHVIANSNSEQDQVLKNVVRDGVLARFGAELDPLSDIEDSRAFLLKNLENIQEYAAYLVERESYNYPVYGVLDNTFFPTRTYGNMSFPAGEYEALRLIIGEGAGNNWWCVMFPPLCYVDGTTRARIADDSILEDSILEDHISKDLISKDLISKHNLIQSPTTAMMATVATAPVPVPEDYTVLWHLLSDDTYAVMNHSQRDTGVTIRFKIVEWWQERMN